MSSPTPAQASGRTAKGDSSPPPHLTQRLIEGWPTGWTESDEVTLEEGGRAITYMPRLQNLMDDDVQFGNAIVVRSNVAIPSEHAVRDAGPSSKRADQEQRPIQLLHLPLIILREAVFTGL